MNSILALGTVAALGAVQGFKRVDILLLEQLVPEAQAWLEARYRVDSRPHLAEDPASLRKLVARAQALVLPRKFVVTRELLDQAPFLRAIARLHAGTDNTDLEACRERNVRVIETTSANLRSNAEYLLASLLLLYRRGLGSALAGERHAQVRMGRELNGSVVGIFGLAPAAHALALMLHALGAKLIGYDPAVHHTATIWKRLQVRPVSLPEMLAQADAVSVQVIYASRYRGFINDKVLAHCKRGQLWVGISRSDLFDATALAGALTDGRIEACLLDGAEAGFASKGSPLHEMTNLHLTPRLGSNTRESLARASWHVAHRIDEALAESSSGGFENAPTQPMGLDFPGDGKHG